MMKKYCSHNKTFIIAEAGVNHNGDLNIAKKLVDIASDSGADAVKFQTYKTENLVIYDAKLAEYQSKTVSHTKTQFEMLKKLELSKENHHQLINHCSKKNIKFMSTAFDCDSIEFLKSCGVTPWKIPSGEITNYPYLRHIGMFQQDVIISTGIATIEEIEQAICVLEQAGTNRSQITLLHCSSEYPVSYQDINLRAIITLKELFQIPVGYSDHSKGIEVAIASVGLGASVIEKHFTLDKLMDGPDHKASLSPNELSTMIKSIRNVELCLGDGKKRPLGSERKNKNIIRKSIVAMRKIRKGEKLTEKNITVKRPGFGISPMEWNKVIGSYAKQNYLPDEYIIL